MSRQVVRNALDDAFHEVDSDNERQGYLTREEFARLCVILDGRLTQDVVEDSLAAAGFGPDVPKLCTLDLVDWMFESPDPSEADTPVSERVTIRENKARQRVEAPAAATKVDAQDVNSTNAQQADVQKDADGRHAKGHPTTDTTIRSASSPSRRQAPTPSSPLTVSARTPRVVVVAPPEKVAEATTELQRGNPQPATQAIASVFDGMGKLDHGTMTREQLWKLLSRLSGGKVFTEDELSKLIRKCRQNDDGTVNVNEFLFNLVPARH